MGPSNSSYGKNEFTGMTQPDFTAENFEVYAVWSVAEML